MDGGRPDVRDSHSGETVAEDAGWAGGGVGDVDGVGEIIC